MSKKILAALLAVMMVFSMIPMTAFAAEEDPAVIAAPLGTNTTAGAFKGYAETYTATGVAGSDGIINVAVTATGLKSHTTSKDGAAGYWAGVGVPTGDSYAVGWGNATTVTVADNAYGADKNDSTVTVGEKTYATFYFNVAGEGSKAPTTGDKLAYVFVKTGTAVKKYSINFNGVTPAEPKVVLANFDADGKVVDDTFFDKLVEIRDPSYKKPSADWSGEGPYLDSEKNTLYLVVDGLKVGEGNEYTATVSDGTTEKAIWSGSLGRSSLALRSAFVTSADGSELPEGLQKPGDTVDGQTVKSVSYTFKVYAGEVTDFTGATPVVTSEPVVVNQVTLDAGEGTLTRTPYTGDANKDGVKVEGKKVTVNVVGDPNSIDPEDVAAKCGISEPTAPAGKKFIGWEATDTTKPTSFTAKYGQQYNVSFAVTASDLVTLVSGDVAFENQVEGDKVTPPTVTAKDSTKEFAGWLNNKNQKITLDADGKYVVSSADAAEDTDGDNKIIVLSPSVTDKAPAVPSIEAFGFEEDAAEAVAGLNAAIDSVRGQGQGTVPQSDVAPKTMWVVFDNLAAGTYKLNLNYNNGTSATGGEVKVGAGKIGPGQEFTVGNEAGQLKTNPAIYWTFSQAAEDTAGTVTNEDLLGTSYTVSLQKKKADGTFEDVKAADGETNLTATIEIAEIKFENEKVEGTNKVVKDNFYQLGEDGTVAITLPDDPAAVEGFNFGGWVDADGNAATTTFTKPAGNGGTVVTYKAKWVAKATEGTITAGFNWKGDEGNTAIKTALTAASKDADVTDSLDQVYWMVINEDVVGNHYWKQVVLRREGEADKVLMSKAYNPAADAVGYEYNSFLHSAQNTIDATVKAGDKLVFNVYKSAEALTAKPTNIAPMTATVEVPANPFMIDEAEYVPATKTVTAKFNENLYGRYWIELTKQGEATPIAIVKTECDRDVPTDGIMKDTGVALVSANALTSGTYTVSLYQRKSAADEKVGDAIATKEFKLDDSIATVEVYEGTSETVSDRITATYVPATQEAAAKIELVGIIVNPADITVKLVAKDADGKEVGKVEGAVLTYDPAQNKFTTTAKLTTILGTEVAIDLTKLVAVATPVVEPTVSVTPPENADHLTEDEVKELTDTAASVQPTEEAKTVLTEKVTETVVEVDKDEDYTPAAVLDDVKAALENTEVTAEEVTIVVQPYLHVEAKDLVTDESGAKTLKFDISAKYRVVATTADPSNEELVLTDEATAEKPANAVDVTKDTEDNELTVTESITLTIELPTGFATAGATVYVLHDKNKAHYHAGTVAEDGKTLTFTSSDGLSPFEISSNAAVVAMVGTTYYATLQEAVDALGTNGGTIELVGNVTEKRVKVSGDSDKVITIVAGDKEFDPAIVVKGSSKAKLTREYDEATKTYTFTYKAPTGGGSTGPIGGGTTSANVTTSTVENGKITVSNSNATAGQQVTVTVKPEKDYYVVTGVTVTGSIAGNVSTTKNADGTYTFTMPNGTVKVAATIKHMYDVFTDIENEKAEKDYAEAIKWAVEANVTRGTDAENYSTFSPWAGCTRKEMVLFLYRRAGQPTVTDPVVNFTDISDAKYDVYRDAIKWAVANNITVGTSETTFSPDADCSRGEMVTFLYRFNKEPEVTGTNSFTDVESGEYYAVPVQWAVSNGITKGTNEEQTTFSPENVCHRVEMVTFLHRDATK